MTRLPRLSMEHLWAIAIPLLTFFAVSTNPITPNDFWWHLRVGQDIVSTGAIPTQDAYSWVMVGATYTNYAAYWLMEVVLYVFYTVGGTPLVLLMHSLIITLAYCLLFLLCRQVSGSWRIAAASTVFAVAIGAYAWAVRPQAIAFPLGVLTLWAIYTYRRNRAWWLMAFFPVITLVWVNSHGSFFVGMVMVAIWLVAELLDATVDKLVGRQREPARQWWPPALALAIMAMASLVNPRGAAGVAYVLNLSSNPIIQNLVPEWAAPTIKTSYGLIFLTSLLLSAVLLAISPKRPASMSVITFVVFAGMALLTTRAIVWYGIAMGPILADHVAALADQLRDLRQQKETNSPSALSKPAGKGSSFRAQESRPPAHAKTTYLNYVIVGILCIVAVLALPWFKHILPLPSYRTSVVAPETPIAATEFLLEERPPGPLFNDLVLGSYLIWAAQPEYPVSADPRLELYPLSHWLDYILVSTGQPGWDATLSQQGVNTLMLSTAEQSSLIAQVRTSQNWCLIYEDASAVIFTRVSGHERCRL